MMLLLALAATFVNLASAQDPPAPGVCAVAAGNLVAAANVTLQAAKNVTADANADLDLALADQMALEEMIAELNRNLTALERELERAEAVVANEQEDADEAADEVRDSPNTFLSRNG